jgi:hypothetical protein
MRPVSSAGGSPSANSAVELAPSNAAGGFGSIASDFDVSNLDGGRADVERKIRRAAADLLKR